MEYMSDKSNVNKLTSREHHDESPGLLNQDGRVIAVHDQVLLLLKIVLKGPNLLATVISSQLVV